MKIKEIIKHLEKYESDYKLVFNKGNGVFKYVKIENIEVDEYTREIILN